MQKTILIILTFFLFSINTHAQQTDETTIRTVLSNQTNAWNKGDINAFMNTYWQSDSLMFIGKNGVTYGWQKTLDNYKKNYPDTAAMGKLDFEILQLKPLSADYFFVTGKWHLTRSIGNVGGVFTLLLYRLKNNWVIVTDHST